MRIAVVTPRMASGERGGAENLYEGLVKALRCAGHETDQVEVTVDESTFDKILEAYSACYHLNLDDYDVVISTKAPTFMVRHRNHVSYLLHTIRVFYDMFKLEFGHGSDELRRQRKIIHECDKFGLSPDRVKKHFVNGSPVYRRMIEVDDFWNGVNFEALHHPPKLESFKEPKQGEIIFFPGRLHHWKRPELIIEAMKYVRHNVPLVIPGRGEDEQHCRELAKGDDRIRFVGWIDDGELAELYSQSIVVPFVPINEDFGLITVEAFKSKKPVLTCTDSGEPANIIKDGETGYIVDPDPKQIADKINYLIEHPEEARKMGEMGYESIGYITWERVVEKLLDGIDIPENGASNIRVLVTDMQPIEPAVGGGRLRLKGLYSNFPDYCDVTYVGTYDWKGEKYRELQISRNLTEIDIPLSDEHFRVNEYLNQLVPGKTIIDSVFPLMVDTSPEYLEKVISEAAQADVIILSHPWLYPALSTRIDLKHKILVYDSHNCESLLRTKLLGQTPFAKCLVQYVTFVEKAVCEAADLVLACSEEDRQAFVDLYRINEAKVEIFPNGVDTTMILPAISEEKRKCKERLKIGPKAAIFIGSNYQPNVDAGRFIIDHLASECPDITFCIVGGVGTALSAADRDNVRIFGVVSDEEKQVILSASDLAINPMFSGSGTNIKMFDFMAAGLPVVSTPVGARGIENDAAFIVTEAPEFSEHIQRLLSDQRDYRELSENALKLVRGKYDWGKISRRLGTRVQAIYSRAAPFFSVIIPTFRGEGHISELIHRLNRQTFQDFEVVLVDSGKDNGDLYRAMCNFNLRYVYKPGIGAAKARNTGIAVARGTVVAFTDDDCRPELDWLKNARKYFDSSDIAGIEGYISTDESKLSDPNYRTVTNKGFEGIGFMTANLLVRTSVLLKIGGFDERLDKPHFREDTDLAWRAQDYGRIPYAKDVEVYHPPHLRQVAGESKADRDYFFVNDAILFSKFPDKYITLLKAEGHFKNNPNFWRYFVEGCEQHGNKAPFAKLVNDPEISGYVPSRLKSMIKVING